MAPKPPKATRRSPDSTEEPTNVQCHEHQIGRSDNQQLTSSSNDNTSGHTHGGYHGRETSCNGNAHDAKDDPWYEDENPVDPVSSRR
jgi:hypothetical protein